MREFLAFISIFFLSWTISGQEQTTIRLSSEIERSPVSFANVTVVGQNSGILYSDQDGEVSIMVSEKTRVKISHINFQDTAIWVSPKKKIYQVSLKISSNAIGPVDVLADPTPEVVYENEQFHVADFMFIDEGLLILSYTKKRLLKSGSQSKDDILDQCQLIILDDNMQTGIKSRFISDGIKLIRDDSGQVFLKTVERVYFMHLNEDVLSLLPLEDGSEIVGNSAFKVETENGKNGFSIYSNYDETYPAFQYFIHHTDSSEAKVLCTVEDEERMHMFRAQYRDLQPREKLQVTRMEDKSGIDKEIISGYLTGFHQQFHFQPPYAPAFYAKEKIVVFEYCADSLKMYDSKGKIDKSLALGIHKKPKRSGWRKKMIQDEVTESIYNLFSIGPQTWIGEVSLETGELLGKFELAYNYPTKVQVRNGEVFYLYRPFGSSQRTYLYKETTR